MKKILLTNNSLLINKNYDLIYSDSPYVIENNNQVIYLDTLLENEIDKKIINIRKKGFILNDLIIENFFQNLKIEILN